MSSAFLHFGNADDQSPHTCNRFVHCRRPLRTAGGGGDRVDDKHGQMRRKRQSLRPVLDSDRIPSTTAGLGGGATWGEKGLKKRLCACASIFTK